MDSVLKFGGSSVASATNMSRVLDIVEKQAAKGKVVLVSSAISGCTDALLRADEKSLADMEKRHRDIVTRLFTGAERQQVQQQVDTLFTELRRAPVPEQVTFGEILSTTILCAKLQAEGIPAVWLDSRKLVVKEDEAETFRRIRQAVRGTDAPIYVAPGFICQDKDGNISTLGRGGSDYSAALYAAAIGAGSLQIWTDVPGIMTANPKQVPAARTIPRMSYAAALDMASHGAKVLYAPTVAPAMAAGIDIEIRNTFAPEGKYTVIGAEADAARWIGVASEGGHIRLAGSRTAAPGTGCEAASKALTEAGIAALSIRAEGASLDVRVRESVLEQALRALHRAFFQELPIEEINLFIAGDGAVAGALLGMLRQTADTVKERTGKLLRVVGRANSRQWGIDLGGQPQLSQSGDYIAAILQSAPKGALFVDVTDSETLYKRYVELLEAGIGIVSSNRRSIAVPYPEYAAMQAAARENGVPFRYETTVGAALPMLESIARGTNSCNEILSIEAVVSCTLNQILGDYRPGGESFASLVRKAQASGLTEPDPRLDLSGRDALRKLLILAREAGVQLEEEDVEITPVVPLAGGSVEDFYQALEAQEEALSRAAREAELQGFRRRFVASLEKTADGYRAGIGIRNVPPVHPAYHLRGTENAIIVRSAFHPYPLVIQGPGEGAREAASSILNDLLR
ncbi:MAG: aspartate kinase [Bacteroidales bacterium]|nr:aspartate kinase [Bacteroidales bacterium]